MSRKVTLWVMVVFITSLVIVQATLSSVEHCSEIYDYRKCRIYINKLYVEKVYFVQKSIDEENVTMKALLFDLDGTLVESEWLAKKAYGYSIQKVFKREMTLLEQQHILGKPVSAFLMKYADNEKALLELITEYYEQHLEKIQPYNRISDNLTQLQLAGLKMGVVTSQVKKFAEKSLFTTHLSTYFQVIIAAEDCREHKPHPLPLLLAAQQLQVDVTDCLYIGDQPTDIEAAQAARMQSAAALWGEGNVENLLPLSPTHVFVAPDALLALVKTQEKLSPSKGCV